MRVCRVCRVQDEQDKQDERSRQDEQDERNRQDERCGQDERGGQDRQNERSAYGPLFYLSFLDCPFCEHVLRKKNALSRLQGRSTPPRATRKHGAEINICYDLDQFNLLFC